MPSQYGASVYCTLEVDIGRASLRCVIYPPPTDYRVLQQHIYPIHSQEGWLCVVSSWASSSFCTVFSEFATASSLKVFAGRKLPNFDTREQSVVQAGGTSCILGRSIQRLERIRSDCHFGLVQWRDHILCRVTLIQLLACVPVSYGVNSFSTSSPVCTSVLLFPAALQTIPISQVRESTMCAWTNTVWYLSLAIFVCGCPNTAGNNPIVAEDVDTNVVYSRMTTILFPLSLNPVLLRWSRHIVRLGLYPETETVGIF